MKRPFLLAQSFLFVRANNDWFYDQSEQLNIEETKLGPRPIALTELAKTCSKTMHAPGDDDPDVDAERFY